MYRIRYKWPAALFLALAVLLGLPGGRAARAQSAPQMVLAQMILQLQTGTPNPAWYGQELWNTIAVQTGATGRYPQLVLLGPVQNIVVNNQVQLPAGELYSMTAIHQNGTSTWVIGYSKLTGRIEYANFNVGGAAQTLPTAPPMPGPAPAPPNGSRTVEQPDNPLPQPAPASPSAKTTESEACRKFPSLC